jgi:hypothetical protein
MTWYDGMETFAAGLAGARGLGKLGDGLDAARNLLEEGASSALSFAEIVEAADQHDEDGRDDAANHENPPRHFSPPSAEEALPLPAYRPPRLWAMKRISAAMLATP